MKSKSIYLASILILIISVSASTYAIHIPEGSDEVGFIVDHWHNGTKMGSGIFTVSSNINFGGLNVSNITDFQAQNLRIPDCSTEQVLQSDNNGNLNCVNPSSLVDITANYTTTFPGLDTNVTVPSDVSIRHVFGSFVIAGGSFSARSVNIEKSCDGEAFVRMQRMRVPGGLDSNFNKAFGFSLEGGCIYRFTSDETGGSVDNDAYSFIDWSV